MDLRSDHSLSEEEHRRLSSLFHSLDVNNDGRIDIEDLRSALKTQVPGHAQRLIAKYDSNQDGHLDFQDFVEWVLEHEQKLRLSFEKLDHNKDGRIDLSELQQAFHHLGFKITPQEAHRMVTHMDKDRTLTISFEEWREYLQFHFSAEIEDIFHYWHHATIIDIGEDLVIPDDFKQSDMETGMWWRHLMAGGAAGAVSRTCTAPLDRLKVLLQVHGSSSNNLGIVTGFRSMLHEGGVKSLWRGNGINVLKIAPETALKFMGYEQIKRLIKQGTNRELGLAERFCAGSMAGAISQSVIYPMEVIKTRLALRKTGQYRGIADCASKLAKREGALCFYRGYVPNLLGIIPYAGIDLTIYETLKRFYIKNHSMGSDPGVFVLLACGTTSSLCGQLASYPLALIRTKLQAKSNTTDTMLSLFRSIWQQEGVRGLYRGITPNFMKVAPAVSISYVVYEHCRKLLGVEMT